MTNIHDILPNQKPKQNENLTLKVETNYKFTLQWTKYGAILNLYLRSHHDYPEIIPDETIDCQHYSQPTTPSTLQDLPTNIQQQFKDIVRIIKNKYNFKKETQTTCISCHSQNGNRILQFTQVLN